LNHRVTENTEKRQETQFLFRSVFSVTLWLVPLLAIGFLAACSASAQRNQDNRLILDGTANAGAAAAEVIGAATPLEASALLLMGQATSIWESSPSAPLPSGSSENAPLIDRDILGGVEDGAPVRSADQNYYEARAYDYLLIEAHKASAQALAKIARRDLTFAHLFEEPQRYRGAVVHVDGRLRMLRGFSAPRFAAKQGVPTLYEGWVFEEGSLGNPYCIIVTEVPASIQLGDRIERRVSFDGYFFKRYRYKAQGDTWRDAPLLIGHHLLDLPTGPAVAEASGLADSFLTGLLVVLGGTVAVVSGLAWWYLRGDKQVRSRLEKTRKSAFTESGFLLKPPAQEESS
jgi:hypothetical protein